MAQLSEDAKATIDKLTKDELRYEIHLGWQSRFQREKFAYLKTRLEQIEELEKAKENSTISLFGVTVPLSQKAALGAIIVFAGVLVWWNWADIAERLGLSGPSLASELEGEIAVLSQNWKLCRNSPGCTPGQKIAIGRKAESLLARATRLEGDDRRDLVAKATAILDETRLVVRPYPIDGMVPQVESIEELEDGSGEN